MLSIAEEKLQERGIQLQLAALNPRALAIIKRSKLGKKLSNNRLFITVEEGVDHYQRSETT